MPRLSSSPRRAEVRALDVSSSQALASLLPSVVSPRPRPVVVLVGAAGGLAPDVAERLLACFRSCLCPLLERLGAVVLDGGTDAGVMAIIGRARREAAASFPLLGVAARGTLLDAGETASVGVSRAWPEPHHDLLLRVPGEEWGDEIPWMSLAAGLLARGSASLTLVAGGGRVTAMDVAASLQAGRPVLALAGSGGMADRLAAAALGAAVPADLPFSLPLVHEVAADDGWAALETRLAALLGGGPAAAAESAESAG